LTLRGRRALSDFRATKLLQTLRRTLPDLQDVATEHRYFVDCERPLSEVELGRLQDLLDDPSVPAEDLPRGPTLLVTPRLGTISPWSSRPPTSHTIVGSPRCGASSAAPCSRWR